MPDFTADDIALAIEIPGIYDGTSAYLLRDGTLVNRWDTPDWRGSRRYRATQRWIDAHGDECREWNRDLLDAEESS